MSINYLKTPLGRSLDQFAHRKVLHGIRSLGQALPCEIVTVNGALVEVKFEVQSGFTLPNIVVPTSNSRYIRQPFQPGDQGVVFPADARVSGITGQGGGTADLSQPGNLTALTFFPISNTANPPPDPNALFLAGPGGVTAQDLGGACVWKLTSSGITATIGGVTVTIDSNGLSVTGGDVKADTISLKTHLTSAVQSGGGTSGPPVAG
ncbi:MAG TPA: hypothetical protein VGC09_00520 [Rhodopila sp.]